MSTAAPISPPPLREGDQLTSDEFMRRWEAMPDLKHAELIDGIVCMASPVRIQHAAFQQPLAAWLVNFEAQTPGCQSGADGTWLMSERDVAQPDLALRILPEYGGQSRVRGDYAAGAPELIVETAVSSRSQDLGRKWKLYERMGVREYLVAVAAKKQLIWSELTASGYQPIKTDADGFIRSRCFPGLWLDLAAFWNRDLKRLFAVLEQGLATPEHASFVTGCSAARIEARLRN